MFSASVTNLFGKTDMASHTITVGNYNIPQVTVSPEAGSFEPGTSVPLSASVVVSDCLLADMRRVVFEWVSNPVGLITGPTDQYSTTIDTSHLNSRAEGTVTVKVSLVSMTELSVTTVTTYGRAVLPPVASISGGSRRMPRQSSAIHMDASSSSAFDGDLAFTWTCTSYITMLPCTDSLNNAFTLPSIATFDLPAQKLALGAYRFSVEVQDTINGLTSTASQLIIPQQGRVPDIIIHQSASVVNEADSIAFFVDVTSEYDIGSLIFQWTSTDVDVSSMTGDSSSHLLVLSSESFMAGQEISVMCHVSDPSGLSATSTTAFQVNTPPHAGEIHLSVLSAEVFTDLVTLTTFNWEDNEGGPFTYQWIVSGNSSSTALSGISSKQQITIHAPQPFDGETSVQITVIARDSFGAAATASKTLEVTMPAGGLTEDLALSALSISQKKLQDTGSPDQTVSLLSSIFNADPITRRRLSASFEDDLTTILSSVSQLTDAATAIKLITQLSSKIFTISDNQKTLLSLLEDALDVLRTETITGIERQAALEQTFVMAVTALDKPDLRRSTNSEVDSLIAIFRAILTDVSINTFQFADQTYTQDYEGKMLFSSRSDATVGFALTNITESVSVSSAVSGITTEPTFDVHALVFPTRLASEELNFSPPVPASALPVGEVDISAVSSSGTAIEISSIVQFSPVNYTVARCDYCQPTCVVLTANGWSLTGVMTDGWTCAMTSSEPVRVSMFSLSCGDGTESCVTTCGNGVVDEYEECDVGQDASAMCVDCVIQSGYTCTLEHGLISVCALDSENACFAAVLPDTLRECAKCRQDTPMLCGECDIGFVPFASGCASSSATSFSIDAVSGTPDITLLAASDLAVGLIIDVPAGLGAAATSLAFAIEETPTSVALPGYSTEPLMQFSLSAYLGETSLGSTALTTPIIFKTELTPDMITSGFTPSLLWINDGKASLAKSSCNNVFEVVTDSVLVTHVCHLSTFAVANIKTVELIDSLDDGVSSQVTSDDDDDSSATLYVVLGLVMLGFVGIGVVGLRFFTKEKVCGTTSFFFVLLKLTVFVELNFSS